VGVEAVEKMSERKIMARVRQHFLAQSKPLLCARVIVAGCLPLHLSINNHQHPYFSKSFVCSERNNSAGSEI
jgi:hypothetical protein